MQTTPLVAGLAIGAAAYAGRALIQVGSTWQAAGTAVGRSFYKVRPQYCLCPACHNFAVKIRAAYLVNVKYILLVSHRMHRNTQAHPCCRAAFRQK